MNKPASKEPSMDEILSSIRQIIADDDIPEDAHEPQSAAGDGNSEVLVSSEALAVEEVADADMVASEPEQMADMDLDVGGNDGDEGLLELSPEQMIDDTPALSEEVVSADLSDEAGEAETLIAEPDVVPEEDAEEAIEMVIADDIAFDDPEEEPQTEVEPVAMPDPELSTDIAEKLLEPTTAAAVSHTFSKLGALTIAGDQLTLDGMLREMLRPMLKEWLDENLPATVERMVEKEIERVSRGS